MPGLRRFAGAACRCGRAGGARPQGEPRGCGRDTRADDRDWRRCVPPAGIGRAGAVGCGTHGPDGRRGPPVHVQRRGSVTRDTRQDRRDADGFCWFGARLRCVRRKKRQSSLYGALTRTTSRSAHTPLYVFLSQSHEDVPNVSAPVCPVVCLWLWLRPPRFRSHVSVVWVVQLVAARTAPHFGHCQSAYLPPACRARVASARPARSTCLILARSQEFRQVPLDAMLADPKHLEPQVWPLAA